MAIEITQEEAKVLSQFSYMNLSKGDYNKRTLKEMATKLLRDKVEDEKAGEIPRGFGGWGGCTDKEQYDMLQAISAGKYKNLSNLTVKNYVNNEEKKDKFVAYAFEDTNHPQNVICAFRGTMGTRVEQNNFMEEFKGKLGSSWWNNYNQILNDANPQYPLAVAFVKENIVPGGDTVSVGHSQGGGDALYTSAVIPGVRCIAFDAPGIKNSLTDEQAARLTLQSENIASQIDFCSSSGSHPEPRRWSQYFEYPQLDKDGKEIKDENGKVKMLEGISAGHYLQTLGFDAAGSHIPGQRSEFSNAIEVLSQKLYIENKAEGNQLGDDLLLRQIVVLKDPEGVKEIIEQEKRLRPELAKEFDDRLVRIQIAAEKIQSAGKIMDDALNALNPFKSLHLEPGTSAVIVVNSKLAHDSDRLFQNTLKNHPEANRAFEKIMDIEGKTHPGMVAGVRAWNNVSNGLAEVRAIGDYVIAGVSTAADAIIEPLRTHPATYAEGIAASNKPGVNIATQSSIDEALQANANPQTDTSNKQTAAPVPTSTDYDAGLGYNATVDRRPDQKTSFDYSANFDRLLKIGETVDKEYGLGVGDAAQTVSRYIGFGR